MTHGDARSAKHRRGRPKQAPGGAIERVRVVLPSSPPHDPADLLAGIGWLRRRGVEVTGPGPGATRPLPFLAGSDEARARELATALSGARCDAVWCGRGGGGSLRTLEALDRLQAPDPGGRGRSMEGSAVRREEGALGAAPQRPLVGLSDATAILLARAFGPRPGIAIHGPVITQLPRLDEPSAAALSAWLRAPDRLPTLHASGDGPRVGGRAEGVLVAGNLALLACCAGTPEAIDGRGRILLVEEIGEPPYRIDRMFAQLARSGGLKGLRGLAFGTFEACPRPGELHAVLMDWARRLGVPCAGHFPVGHGGACWPVAPGLRYRLVAGEGSLEPRQRPSEWLAARGADG